MIYDGTLDAYPGLKIVVAHGGGFLPSYIGRYDHGHNSNDRGGRGEEKKKPSDYLKQLYFDTLVFGTENLRAPHQRVRDRSNGHGDRSSGGHGEYQSHRAHLERAGPERGRYRKNARRHAEKTVEALTREKN
jgi:hypothetical protein